MIARQSTPIEIKAPKCDNFLPFRCSGTESLSALPTIMAPNPTYPSPLEPQMPYSIPAFRQVMVRGPELRDMPSSASLPTMTPSKLPRLKINGAGKAIFEQKTSVQNMQTFKNSVSLGGGPTPGMATRNLASTTPQLAMPVPQSATMSALETKTS